MYWAVVAVGMWVRCGAAAAIGTTPWAFHGVTLVDGGSSKGPGEGSLTVNGAIKACARLGA